MTENGTVIYTFPEVMRTSDTERKGIGQVPLLNPASKRLVPFSANKKKTNGWILFFNAVNLAFGAYFLLLSVTQGAAAIVKTGPMLYSFTGNLLSQAGISPVPFMAIVLGIIPAAFSVVFFLVPFLRRLRLNRQNALLREEALRRRVYTQVLSSPAHVAASDIKPARNEMDPPDLVAACRRVLDRLAAALKAEPIVQEKEAVFAYRFSELERELSDLEEYPQGHRYQQVRGGQNGFRFRAVAGGAGRGLTERTFSDCSVRSTGRRDLPSIPAHPRAPACASIRP